MSNFHVFHGQVLSRTQSQRSSRVLTTPEYGTVLAPSRQAFTSAHRMPSRFDFYSLIPAHRFLYVYARVCLLIAPFLRFLRRPKFRGLQVTERSAGNSALAI